MEICKVAGVSTATVSRVINGSPLVLESTRLRVQQAIEQLGYRPNFAARMLARDRTETVAVIIPGMGRDYFMEVLSAVDQVTGAHRHHVMIAISHGEEDEGALLKRYIRERRADGVIILALASGLDQPIRELGPSSRPIVVIGRPVQLPDVGSVSIDNRSGAEQVVRHLLSQGCRRLAVVKGYDAVYDSKERLEGALRKAAQAGCPIPDSRIWQGSFQAQVAYEVVKTQLSQPGPRPDALFALNDDMALGARSAIKELGLSIPDDIALAGFDDVPAMQHIGMTSVHNPMHELGRRAAEMLMARLKGDAQALRHEVLPTRLVVRASSTRAQPVAAG